MLSAPDKPFVYGDGRVHGLLALAKAYLLIGDMHESSYVKEENIHDSRYSKTCEECATELNIPPQLSYLAILMFTNGYGEYYDWACAIIARYEPNWDKMRRASLDAGKEWLSKYYDSWPDHIDNE